MVKNKWAGYNPNFYKDKEKSLNDLKDNFMSSKNLKDIVSLKYKTLGNHYSFYNNINAMLQCQDYKTEFTGTLKGFKQWQTIEVNILPDQRKNKLYILIPVFKWYDQNGKQVRVKKGDNTTGLKRVLSYFSVGYIFDISQTDSDDYKKYKNDLYSNVHYNAEMEKVINFNDTLKFVKDNFDYKIITNDHDTDDYKPANLGSYNPHDYTITLRKNYSQTLLHEFSHHLQKDTKKVLLAEKQNYDVNEVIAEISTFLIVNTIQPNIDYNFNYSNCWSSNINLDYSEFEKLFNTINSNLEKLDYKVYKV